MIQNSEYVYSGLSWPSPSRRNRYVALAIVLLLHFALLTITIEKHMTAPDPVQAVRVVDIPIVPPQFESTRIEDPKLQAPAPPEVPAPEIWVETPEIVVPAFNPLLATVTPSVAPAGDGRKSSGGNSGAENAGHGAGDGTGSGLSAYTTCTNRLMPLYPASAKNRGEHGRVTLLVELDERGKLTVLSVARSTGSPTLDAASIDAIRRWRCSPVMESGRAVSVITKQEFEFTLKK